MKALIKLTMNYGDCPIWVNPSYIASMIKDKEGSAIFIAMDSGPTYVKETPEQIIQMIQSAYGE